MALLDDGAGDASPAAAWKDLARNLWRATVWGQYPGWAFTPHHPPHRPRTGNPIHLAEWALRADLQQQMRLFAWLGRVMLIGACTLLQLCLWALWLLAVPLVALILLGKIVRPRQREVGIDKVLLPLYRGAGRVARWPGLPLIVRAHVFYRAQRMWERRYHARYYPAGAPPIARAQHALYTQKRSPHTKLIIVAEPALGSTYTCGTLNKVAFIYAPSIVAKPGFGVLVRIAFSERLAHSAVLLGDSPEPSV